MKTEHDWQKVLLKAASIVEEGWCQGIMRISVFGAPDKYCASKAIRVAAIRNEDKDIYSGTDAHRKLQRYLRSSPGMGERITIALWNDHPDRTATEVAEAMRQAAT